MMNTYTERVVQFRNGVEVTATKPDGGAGKEPPEHSTVTWPEAPEPEAYHGLAGDVVRAIEAHSEADPIALLVQTLAFFGNVIGSGPYFRVESDLHRANLDVVLVGQTSKGRKGTARGRVEEMFQTGDADWLKNRVMGGLSSGEGLIWSCRDKVERYVAIREKGKPTRYEYEDVDPGIADKRLLVVETEFARVLKMASRDGNILSEVIRQSFDTGNLRSMTKNSPATATGAHISIIGHITQNELLRSLSETEQANGFGNRFCWLCVRRSKYLPDDEDRRLDPLVVADLQERIKGAVEFARNPGEMRRNDPARDAWRAVYRKLSDPKPGLMGAMLARSEAQVLRLSMIYALLDKSATVRLEHLKAALALWEYCEGSARFIFGDALGDPTADTMLQALRNSPSGLTRTDISALFARHKPAKEVARALGVLASLGLATFRSEETDGRTTERWTAQ
jgi:hypothetical protein